MLDLISHDELRLQKNKKQKTVHKGWNLILSVANKSVEKTIRATQKAVMSTLFIWQRILDLSYELLYSAYVWSIKLANWLTMNVINLAVLFLHFDMALKKGEIMSSKMTRKTKVIEAFWDRLPSSTRNLNHLKFFIGKRLVWLGSCPALTTKLHLFLSRPNSISSVMLVNSQRVYLLPFGIF